MESREGHADKEAGITDWILRDARRIANREYMSTKDGAPLSRIEREIALTVHALEQTHATHQFIERDMLKSEALIQTELMGVEARTPRYSPYRFPEREKILRRLQGIEVERRQHVLAKRHNLQMLYEKLWDLWEKHRVLNS